jgi:hypothetical protein
LRAYLRDSSANSFTLTVSHRLFTVVIFSAIIIPFTHIFAFTLIGYTHPGFSSFTIIVIGLPVTTADRRVYIRAGIRCISTHTSALTIPDSLEAIRTIRAISSLLTATSHKTG